MSKCVNCGKNSVICNCGYGDDYEAQAYEKSRLDALKSQTNQLIQTIWMLAQYDGRVQYYDDERCCNQICRIANISIDELTLVSEDYQYDGVKFDEVKPILHSTSKLTELVLEGGKVPIVELCRKQGFSIGNLENWKIEYQVSRFNEVAIMQNDEWIFRYMKNENSFWVNGIASYNKKHQKTYNQLELFNFMFENHFNLFNLSEEYFTEKSTVKL